MNDLALPGCSPTPLAHYLKALGILRLVAEDAAHGDPSAAGYWQRDTFHLRTRLDRAALIEFFLNHYRPTPIIAPWNGGSGFYFRERKSKEKDPKTGKKLKLGVRDEPTEATRTVELLSKSDSQRLAPLKAAIRAARTVLADCGLTAAPDSGKEKADLLLCLRSVLPEESFLWLDATLCPNGEEVGPAPLLGSGGNDGNLDYSINFLHHVATVFADAETTAEENKAGLANALFGEPTPSSIKSAVGMLLPSNAGGANAGNGATGISTSNPWDFILMAEGAVVFSASATRRLESSSEARVVSPFSVASVGSGYSSDAPADELSGDKKQTYEVWCPIWERAVNYRELRALFGEGRVDFNRRRAANAVEFAQAVVSLGVDRSISAFQRFGFHFRNGDKYRFATPLDRVAVRRDTVAADLLDDVGPWLDSFRRAARGDRAPSRVSSACRNLERAIFALCTRSPNGQRNDSAVLSVLVQLGSCEAALAASLGWTTEQPRLSPLQLSHPGWLRAALAAAPHETALAQALASLAAPRFRTHLEPVDASGFRWSDQAKDVTWIHGRATAALLTTLQRRLILAEGSDLNPLRGQVPAPLASIVRFIEGRLDESLFESLLLALACYRADALTAHAAPPALSNDELAPSALFALLRTALAGDIPGCANAIPRVPAIVRRAATGDGREASRLAARRLRASGVAPAFASLDQRGDSVKRTAAAILFPLSPSSLGELLQLIQPIQS